eukprot:g47933.t1
MVENTLLESFNKKKNLNNKVKLELGSGEKILRSERGVKLNDLALHKLDLYHEDGEASLRVDNHFKTAVKMPGLLHELNIQHGLFVGGTGRFDKRYMGGAASNFRGCIDEVVFDGRDILSSLRTYSGFKTVHEVSAGCSDEFFAEDSESLSLFSSKSYLEFASWNAEEEGMLECTVRTTQPFGLLLYSAGRQDDFVAMEIAEGLVRAVIGKSGKKTQLSSLSSVNDNNWHDIKLRFTSKHLYLTMDEETVKVTLSARSKNIRLRGPLFIGGIDDSTQREPNSFSTLDLWYGRVLYIHDGSEDSHDQFSFSVFTSTKKLVPDYLKGDRQYRFNITVTPTNDAPALVLPEGLVVEQSDAALITKHNLSVETNAVNQEIEIRYSIAKGPKYGEIQRLQSSGEWKKISSFSQRQKDISAQKVEYELLEKPHEDTEDNFHFQLFSNHAVSLIYTFHTLIKADVNTINLTNNGLTLVEGEGELITWAELFAETLNSKNFVYTIKQSPRFGKLKRINHSDSSNSNDNITTFTNEDILGQRLMYMHDDSESTHDEFIFVAAAADTAIDNSESDPNSLSIMGTFFITIQLRNDEKPVRIVDQLFHVVRNGQRLLTFEDLRYHDPDSDFDDAQLLYTRRGIPNGDLVLVNNTSRKLFQFSQEDLEQKRVLFVHRGADNGRFVLFVTDGKHYTSSLLEVRASDPYVRIVNNTDLLVQKGQGKPLTTANLSVNTNLFIADENEVLPHRAAGQSEASDPAPPGLVVIVGIGGCMGERGNMDSRNPPWNRSLPALANRLPDVIKHLRNKWDLTLHLLVQRQGCYICATRAHETLTENKREQGNSPELGLSSRLVDVLRSHSHREYRPELLMVAGKLRNDTWVDKKLLEIQVDHLDIAPEFEKLWGKKDSPCVMHEDNLPYEIIYKVKIAPAYGYIRRFAEAEGYYVGTEHKPVQYFTQQDLNDGRIQYVQMSADQIKDNFTVDVTNGIVELPGILVRIDIIPSEGIQLGQDDGGALNLAFGLAEEEKDRLLGYGLRG